MGRILLTRLETRRGKFCAGEQLLLKEDSLDVSNGVETHLAGSRGRQLFTTGCTLLSEDGWFIEQSSTTLCFFLLVLINLSCPGSSIPTLDD